MATPITGSTWRRHEMQGGQISVLGQKQTFAAQKAMSALPLNLLQNSSLHRERATIESCDMLI